MIFIGYYMDDNEEKPVFNNREERAEWYKKEQNKSIAELIAEQKLRNLGCSAKNIELPD